MLWRCKVTIFCHRLGLVDFTWVSVFATGSFGNLLFKLRLCVEKGVLLWAVSVETTGHTCHSILYNHTQAFGRGGGTFEDFLPLGSCQVMMGSHFY